MNKFYKFIYCTFRGFFKLVFRMEIKGTENEPDKGPFLICTNHQSNNDIICVAAAGNDGTSRISYPAADPHVISVGALADNSWELADYSNYGENTDVVAPGTT